MRIKTGNIKNAGTDSNIYLQVFGDKGDTGVIELKQICDTKDKFQRGMNTKINLQTVDVGNVSTCNVFLVTHLMVVVVGGDNYNPILKKKPFVGALFRICEYFPDLNYVEFKTTLK